MIWRFAKNTLTALVLTVLVGISGLAIVTRIQGGKLLSVQTKSMVPVLRKGDLVSVKSVPVGSLKPGDIITFINPANKKQTITHRIVALPSTSKTGKVITKGDANQAVDKAIDTTAIVGKLNYSLPFIGYFSDFIRQPLGLMLIIYVPALVIIVSEMKRLAAYYKTQQTYVVPWRRRQSKKSKERAGSAAMAAKLMPFIIIALLTAAVPVHALLQSTARLTGNTISATRPVIPPTNPCTTGTSGNSTTITVTGTGSGNVNVSNSNNQNASTGNATSTNGGNATSGNATNCNSTNINVTIH